MQCSNVVDDGGSAEVRLTILGRDVDVAPLQIHTNTEHISAHRPEPLACVHTCVWAAAEGRDACVDRAAVDAAICCTM